MTTLEHDASTDGQQTFLLVDPADPGLIYCLGAVTRQDVITVCLDPHTGQPAFDRGAHTRFEAGIETSRSETGLYRDTADYLAALGYPVVTIDTSHIRPDRLAAQIGTRIASLARVHGLASTTG